MHRTDIEGFGHYEDRREMELMAGTYGGTPQVSSSLGVGNTIFSG
jgi:hypothetical protein